MAYTITVCKPKLNLKSITVEPIMFLYMFSAFLQHITTQALIYDKVCAQTYNQTICDDLNNKTLHTEEDVVQRTTSTWLLYNNVMLGVPSMFSVLLFLGPLSDRVGRKTPILFPLVGGLLSSLCNILNAVYMDASPGYLLVGSFLNGVMGGFIAALTAMYSYIAHVSTFKGKTVRMGILESMVFLSGTLGTATSGVILDRTSYMFVFCLLSGMMVLALLYTVIWVDNVKVDKDSVMISSDKSSKGVCGLCRLLLNGIKDVFLCVYQQRKNRKRLMNMSMLIFILFCLMLVTIGESDIFLIYTRYRPFHWTQTTLGLFNGLETFIRGSAMITLLPLLKVKFHVRDTTIILLGLVSKICLLVVLGVGRSTEVLFIGGLAGIMTGFCSSAIRSLTSNMLPTSEQAKLFSVIGLCEAIATLAATSLFNTLYSATLDFYPGFCFLMASGIVGMCLLIAIYLHATLVRTADHNYGSLHNHEEDIIVNSDDIPVVDNGDDIVVNGDDIVVNGDDMVVNGDDIRPEVIA